MLYGAAGAGAAPDGGVALDDKLQGVSFIVLDEARRALSRLGSTELLLPAPPASAVNQRCLKDIRAHHLLLLHRWTKTTRRPFSRAQVHYLSDSERGTVWEETIIYCPKDIQILALSATVGNPADLQGWISRVHGPTEVVTSTWRPVPLTFFFAKRVSREGDFPEWCAGWANCNPAHPAKSTLYERLLPLCAKNLFFFLFSDSSCLAALVHS